MNYLKEILAFQNWMEYNSNINKSDIGLWYALMGIANRFNWEEFTVPISTLILKSRLNQSAIYRARNKLKQMGLIDFKERGGNQAAIYKMNPVSEIYTAKNERQNDTQNERQDENERQNERANERADGRQMKEQTKEQTETYIKLETKNQKPETKNKNISLATLEIYNNFDANVPCDTISKSTNSKCKRRSTYQINGKNYCNQHSKEILKDIQYCEIKQNKPQKHKYGEYKNVLLTDEEYEKLIDLCGDDLQGVIEHLSDYIEMKGYKARSHYLAIRKWVIPAYKEQLVRYERAMKLARAGGAIYGGNSGNPEKNPCTEYPE